MSKKLTINDLAEIMKKQFDEFGEKMATKEDLKYFATKEDLKYFATKEDLKYFATKEDLKDFATKKDVRKLITIVDNLAKNVITSKEERVTNIATHDRIDGEIIKIKKRVSVLEKNK